MEKKVVFFGPISPPISGPGVKNQMMIEWLQSNSAVKISVCNTNTIRNGHFFQFAQAFLKFLLTRNVILSVSRNGRFIFIPLCYILGKKVLLFPAGGTFDQEIESMSPLKKKLFLSCCKCISQVYSQTNQLKFGLENLGFRKVLYFPNPRINRNICASPSYSDQFKIVFLSKIREGKGPLLLIEAVQAVRKKHSNITIELSFFGKIEENFKNRFFEYLELSDSNFYKGEANSEDVQKTIAQYNLFVLPTTFPEGVPGAVIEAMFTGIPIIISEFSSAHDLIDNEKEGLIVPQGDVSALVEGIERIIFDENLRETLALNVRQKASRFDFDKMMTKFINQLKKN